MSLLFVGGCAVQPTFIAEEIRTPIDRAIVEAPGGYDISTAVRGLTAPTAFTFVHEEGTYKDTILIAESGAAGAEPHIFGFNFRTLTEYTVYPQSPRIPLLGILRRGKRIYGPISGLAISQGRIIVAHRDQAGLGVISAITFDGDITTLQADLPAQGDYGLTDVAVNPTTGRIWFGCGSATNSGVVGQDNFDDGWARKFAEFCDLVPQNIKLLGLKFFTKNPRAGFFSRDDNVGTGPYQPFGKNNELRIHSDPLGKPTSAVYSISPLGGDLKVEAWGIHVPRGIGFDEYSNAFVTNDGMEMRGTRPIKDDPDSLLKIAEGAWYGFPDFSTDLNPVSDKAYQPPQEMIERNGGYPEIAALVDQSASGLSNPSAFKSSLFWGSVPTMSGASKFDFAPGAGAFHEFTNSVIVALFGDRAPFASGGQLLTESPGYKVVRFDTLTKRVEDFVRNTKQMPASKIGFGVEALERPIDAKFGPDNRLYILDFGRMEMRKGHEKIYPGTGKIFVVQTSAQTPK